MVVSRFLQALRQERLENDPRCFLDEAGKTNRLDPVLEAALASVQAPRPWKQLFDTQSARIIEVVGDVSVAFVPRFGFLTGQTLAEGVEPFRAGVEAGLARLGAAAAARAEVLLQAVAWAPVADSVSPSATESLLQLKVSAFATDLAEDLRHHHKAIQELLASPRDVQALARLHDGLAEGWPKVEISVRFVQELMSELRSPGNEIPC